VTGVQTCALPISCPVLSAVFRAKNAAAFASQIAQRPGTAFKTLDDGHDNIWLARADRQTDPTGLRGKSAAQLFPTSAAVRAFENAADIFAVGRVRPGSETPWGPLSRVKRGVNNLRIAWIENHIAAAGARVVWRR